MEATTNEDKIEGKTFMFTGTLSVTRDEARLIVEELGGIPGSSVNRQTDYLVCGGDQVGKSSKWDKAGLLGVTRVDEDFFWKLVEKAKSKSTEDSEVLVHLEEGEEPTEEQWKIISQVEGLRVMTEDQFVRLLNALLPSYESNYKLEKLVSENDIKVLPPSICKFCGETIPYSIHTSTHVYYCFKCHQYSNQKEHRCIWFDPDVGVGYYMCTLCGDFTKMKGRHFLDQRDHLAGCLYSNSVERIIDRREEAKVRLEAKQAAEKILEDVHYCTDFEQVPELPSDERGFFARCKVCQKVEFVDLAKIGDNVET